jgi:hypothetical protein
MGDIVNSVADLFGLGPASKQANAVEDAARMSAQSSGEALALQRRMYEENAARQQPFLQAGQEALNKLIPLSNYQKFGMDQFQQDPGYAFRLSEGQKALDRQAAARGGLISGGALKAAQRYGQEMGSQEYTNAFNRYQTERNAQLNPLQSLAGVGQTTSQQLGQFGAANAANVGNYLTGGAAAQAAGQVGAANAVTGGLGTYLNYTSNNNLLNALRNRSGGGFPSGTGMTNSPYDFSGISEYS